MRGTAEERKECEIFGKWELARGFGKARFLVHVSLVVRKNRLAHVHISFYFFMFLK